MVSTFSWTFLHIDITVHFLEPGFELVPHRFTVWLKGLVPCRCQHGITSTSSFCVALHFAIPRGRASSTDFATVAVAAVLDVPLFHPSVSFTLSIASHAERTPSILGMTGCQVAIPKIQAGRCLHSLRNCPVSCVTFHLTLQFLLPLCPLSPSWDHWSLFHQSASWSRVDHIATSRTSSDDERLQPCSFCETHCTAGPSQLERSAFAILTIISLICSSAESAEYVPELLFFEVL